jgi:hypothetical protein
MNLTEKQIQKISEKCNHKVVAKFEIDFHFDIGLLNCQSITDFVQVKLETEYTKEDIVKSFFTEENLKELVNWEDNYCDDCEDCEDEYLSEEE